VLEVATHRGGRAGKPLGHLSQLEPNLGAREQSRLRSLRERYARAYEQRLDARHRGVHRLGDLVVGERIDLAQQERRALRLRKVLDVGDDLAELLAPVDRVRGGHAPVALEHVHRVEPRRDRAPQVVQAPVARDAVEPRARVDRPVVGEHRVEGGGEHLLQNVLGILGGAEHVAAEGEQPRLVTLEQRVEGAVVPAPDEGDQLLVALEPEKRGSPGKG
jgi:hypothetical protein